MNLKTWSTKIRADAATKSALLSIIEREGNLSATARALDVQYLTVSRWVNGHFRISAAYARIIRDEARRQ